MDVTLLLNSNGAATLDAEQQNHNEEGDKRPMSRTPWDAGGYSLPINTLSMSQSPFQHAQDEGVLRRDTQAPTSPTQHRFSDSRSSLSSFTSSVQSTTHSRYSSMSTVNSNSNLFQGYVLMDGITSTLRKAPDSLDLSNSDHRGDISSTANLSPTGSLNMLEFDARLPPAFQNLSQQDSSKQVDLSAKYQREISTVPELAYRRSTSPSDAILIKRITVPILRVDTGDAGLGSANELKV